MASTTTTTTTDKNVNGVEHADKKTDKEAVPAAKVVSTEGSKNKSEKKVLFPGDITIKAQLDDDIRCISYNNQELTFVDLLKLLERMFKKAVKATDDLVLKYKDAEGDYVTIEDSDDVGFAIRTCGGLNIKILRSKGEDDVKAKASDIRLELCEIRDRVNKLLDFLDGNELDLSKPSAPTLSTLSLKESPTDIHLTATSQAGSTQPKDGVQTVPSTSEFDPLKGVGSSTETTNTDAGLTSVAHGQRPPTAANQVAVKPEKNTNYPQIANQAQAPPSQQYQVGGGASTVSQVPPQVYQQPQQQQQQQQQPQQGLTTSVVYGQTTPGSPYASTNQYQYSATPSYGGAPTSYASSPNPTAVNSNSWGDSSSGSQARGYPQMGVASSLTSAGQQAHMSPLPSSSAPSSYGSVSQPQTAMASMYGQQVNNAQAPAPPPMGGNQGNAMGTSQSAPQMAPPPMSGQIPPPMGGGVQPSPQMSSVQTAQMGGVQGPPQMGTVQGPPQMGAVQGPPQMGAVQGPPQMGAVQGPPQMHAPPPMGSYRPGGPTPGAGASANPYSRTAANSP